MSERLIELVREDARRELLPRLAEATLRFEELMATWERSNQVVEKFDLRGKLQGIGNVLSEILGYQTEFKETDRPQMHTDSSYPHASGPTDIKLTLEWFSDGAFPNDRYSFVVTVSPDEICVSHGVPELQEDKLDPNTASEKDVDVFVFHAYKQPHLPRRLWDMAG